MLTRLVAAVVACGAIAAPAPVGQDRSPASIISESSLRENLKYLASDLLEGRATPSVGLDLAAEYIASQFRAYGLQPVDEDYFQEAPDSRLNEDGMPTVKNVVGVLPGSDPDLKDTYLLITAHYDHLGVRERTSGDDKVFNGANDNGSGTVAVMEIARALTASGAKPKRTIVFMCFFGEERGMAGSSYYGKNPIFPLDKTVAMLNIEMIGRTIKYSADRSKRGELEDWTGKLGVTGYDYTDIGLRLTASCKKAGIAAIMDKDASDPFFMRSDNRALARLGIPSHTVSVGYEDPEYHRANDHWDTINYENMTLVVRALVYATLDLANDPVAPKWNPDKERAKRYAEAWEKLHGG